jgi:hypothetical protein
MKPRLQAALWFLFSVVTLALAATPWYRTVDALLLSGMATLLLSLSALKVWEIWKSRGNPVEREKKGTIGQLYLFPRSWQRWILDEHDGNEQGKPQSK